MERASGFAKKANRWFFISAASHGCLHTFGGGSQGQRPWRFAEKIFDLEWKSESFLLYILSFIIICIENKKLISYE